MSEPTEKFWETKSLSEMDQTEWESLCDGCGKCCLHKLYNDDDEDLMYTNVVCRLMDVMTCQCSNYENRLEHIPDCVVLTMENLDKLFWMPSTCAYRLLHEGKPLFDWHPLISKDPKSVHKAGVSIQYRAITEDMAGPLAHHVVDWWD